MVDDRNVLASSQDPRFEALRRLGLRYELGELSDDEYKQLKREILYGATPDAGVQVARIELYVATFTRLGQLDAALERLRIHGSDRRRPTIDTVMVRKLATGALRIRVHHDLTRPLLTGHVSVAGAACGLLFPLEPLLAGHAGTPLASSFDALAAPEPERTRLRAIGRDLAPGSTSIVAVCWSSARESVMAGLRTAERVERHVFGAEIATALTTILSASTELRAQQPGSGRR